MKRTMLIMMVSLIISFPMTLQSSTNTEARSLHQIALCLLESKISLTTSAEEVIRINTTSIDCIAQASAFMFWFSKWVNCPHDPDCDESKEQYYKDMMELAEIYLLLCVVMT